MQMSSIFFSFFFFLRHSLGTFSRRQQGFARALQQQGWGCGAREGNKKGSGTEGKGGKAPSPSAPT